jgi:hypothetical protein
MKLATIQPDVLTWWEKASAGALFVASGLYAAEWYIGARMPPQIAAALPWIVSVGGLVTLFAIDGALVSTVMGARAGRRSRWTWITIGVSALFGALVALVLHDALPGWVGSWLHAGFMATIAAYLMHLSQPRQDALAELASHEQALGTALAEHAANVATWHAERDKVMAEQRAMLAEQAARVDAAWQELASREAALAGREQDLDKAAANLASREADLTHYARGLADRQDALARREAEPIARTEIVTTEYVEVAAARLSWADLHRLVDMARQRDGVSMTTLRRLVTKQEGE